jgi:hypothetical protein
MSTDGDGAPLLPRRRYYTSGVVARVLGVAPRTACHLMDKVLPRSARLPGSLHRRVSHRDLCSYIRAHPELDIDLDRLFGPGWDTALPDSLETGSVGPPPAKPAPEEEVR